MTEQHSEKGFIGSLRESRDRQAFHDLIGLAEDVQRRRDRLFQSMITRLLGFILTVIAVTSLAFYVGVTAFGTATLSKNALPAILAGVSMALFLAAALEVRSYLRLESRERRAFYKVMKITHDVLGTYASELSALERAEIEIRLSRLDR